MRVKLVFGVCAFLLVSCISPKTQEPGDQTVVPEVTGDVFVASDGTQLGLQMWQAEDPVAVVIGLHGMNDYSKTFSMPAPWLAERGVTTYAYDQRGFGRSPQRGIWPGTDLMIDDASAFIETIRARHPDIPIFLMGVSMGGAVALSTLAQADPPEVDGLILVSPAVWGWSSLNPFYRMSLWIAAHTFPGGTLTGRSLDITPSDNIEMLRDNFYDDLFIKKTRTDAIYGLVGLMDKGYKSAGRIDVPTLLLYGDKDEIIPRKAVEAVMGALNGETRYALYADGYHMLLRDLQAETVWADVLSWLLDTDAALPSDEELFVDRTNPRLSRN